ncbi:hypothetical protein [Actinoplanes subglobosus]|uniref:Uncharacterized protein n=1 Tax=Actinoplanes subglobosus TaxID=1547892 RepID=A0ABV8ISB0_9ACTN
MTASGVAHVVARVLTGIGVSFRRSGPARPARELTLAGQAGPGLNGTVAVAR